MSEENGRRWYDPHKMTLALGGGMLALVAWWGSLVWGMSQSAQTKNVEQDAILKHVTDNISEMKVKLDKIYDRVK